MRLLSFQNPTQEHTLAHVPERSCHERQKMPSKIPSLSDASWASCRPGISPSDQHQDEKALTQVEAGAGLALLAAALHSMHELVDLIQRCCRRSPGRIQFGCPEMFT